MKKFILPLLLVFTITITAQGKFSEGIVISKQTMTSTNEQVNSQLAMMGDLVTTTYVKGKKSRSELSNPMSGTTVSVFDGDTQQMMLMMDNPMMGKMYIEKSTEVSEDDLEGVTVTKTDETKEILGYTCNKYDYTISKNGATVTGFAYVTEDIEVFSQANTQFGDKIKGLPLLSEMNVNQGGMEMTITNEVTALKKEAVSDDKFDMTAPEGYKKVDNIPGM